MDDIDTLAVANSQLSRPGVRLLAQYLHKMARLPNQTSRPLTVEIVNIAVNMIDSPTIRATLTDILDLALTEERK